MEEDEELVELKENKKALEGGYRDEMKRRSAYRDYLYETMQKIYQEWHFYRTLHPLEIYMHMNLSEIRLPRQLEADEPCRPPGCPIFDEVQGKLYRQSFQEVEKSGDAILSYGGG